MIAVVVVDDAIAFVDAVRFQLPLSRELLLPRELLFLLGPPNSIELLLLSLTVLPIAPLLVLLRQAPLILFRRAGLVCARLLRTSLVVAGPIVASAVISLLSLAAPVAARSSRRLRRHLLVLILATPPIVVTSTALRLCHRGNEEQRCSC